MKLLYMKQNLSERKKVCKGSLFRIKLFLKLWKVQHLKIKLKFQLIPNCPLQVNQLLYF